MINADFPISNDKPESTLINVSRGAVIDEADLLDALNHNQLKAAVLDVFCHEPLALRQSIMATPKSDVTPHISGATYARSAASVIVNNINRMENGEMPEGIFDRIVITVMKEEETTMSEEMNNQTQESPFLALDQIIDLEKYPINDLENPSDQRSHQRLS